MRTPLTTKPLNCPGTGFQARISTLGAFPPLPDGPHKLQIRVRDQTGRFTFYPTDPLNITVKNGAAVPIVGVLESPASGEKLSGTVSVSGYVYSPGQRVTTVSLLVDGRLLSSVRPTQARPEICASLPNADACPAVGFTFTLNTKLLLNGPHVLGILAFSDRGDSVTFPNLVTDGINVSVQNE